MGNEHSHHLHHHHGVTKEALEALPLDITLSFNRKIGTWSKYKGTRGPEIYFQTILPGSERYLTIRLFLEKYLASFEPELSITKITLLYNEKQIENFFKKWASSPYFPSVNATHGKSKHMQQSLDMFQALLDKCSFNTDKFVNPILLTAHGLEQLYSFEIATNGFTDVGTSQGTYGFGLYTSSNPMYCYPYFRNAKQPALLVSWLIPGDVHHITSERDDTLLQKSAFGCNFAAVNQKGAISADPSENIYNEIVILNENQLLPAFIVEFDREEMLKNQVELDRKWNREFCDPTLYQEPPVHRADVEIENNQEFADFNEVAKTLMREQHVDKVVLRDSDSEF